MPALNIFEPTQRREFTFYDRCAIRLTPSELTSCRIRISVTILGSPQYRSLNFKYPYSKEFYGYMQTFYLNAHYGEYPVNYQNQVLLDYFNEHTAIAHQLTDVIQRLTVYLSALGNAVAAVTSTVSTEIAQQLLDQVLEIFRLVFCFTLELDGGEPDITFSDDYLNVFQIPFNLIRFKFPFGTVFAVSIDTWNLGVLQAGSLGGNPETDPIFDPNNPNGQPPFPTPGGEDPENPYGADPPPSSPLDPTLDPDDFSNAPDPDVGRGYQWRALGNVQIAGLDESPRAVDLLSPCYPDPVTIAFEPNPGGVGSDAVVRDLLGGLVDVFFTADLLGTAALTIQRCDL